MLQATNRYIVIFLERQGIPDNATTTGGQGTNRNNPLSDAKIASYSAEMETASRPSTPPHRSIYTETGAEMGTASRPSTPPHRSIYTETGADAQAIEAAISLSPEESVGSNGHAGRNINEGVTEGRFSYKGIG